LPDCGLAFLQNQLMLATTVFESRGQPSARRRWLIPEIKTAERPASWAFGFAK
jgi:hypothetical protein